MECCIYLYRILNIWFYCEAILKKKMIAELLHEVEILELKHCGTFFLFILRTAEKTDDSQRF